MAWKIIISRNLNKVKHNEQNCTNIELKSITIKNNGNANQQTNKKRNTNNWNMNKQQKKQTNKQLIFVWNTGWKLKGSKNYSAGDPHMKYSCYQQNAKQKAY